jgi:hypothetical protein
MGDTPETRGAFFGDRFDPFEVVVPADVKTSFKVENESGSPLASGGGISAAAAVFFCQGDFVVGMTS